MENRNNALARDAVVEADSPLEPKMTVRSRNVDELIIGEDAVRDHHGPTLDDEQVNRSPIRLDDLSGEPRPDFEPVADRKWTLDG